MPGCNFHEAIRRAQRFGVILERLISPEGTLPVFGRSITYRTGSLQTLALLAWRNWLPEELSNGQVRAAMTLSSNVCSETAATSIQQAF